MLICVMTHDGWRPIEADRQYVFGDFAAHQYLDREETADLTYSVTHIPSGLMCVPARDSEGIYSWDHIEGAARFARELSISVKPGDIYQDENGIWRVAERMKPKWRKIMNKMGYVV